MNVIEVKGLSKKYRIGKADKRADTLTGALLNGLRSPIQNLRNIRNLSQLDRDEDSVSWALRDVSFDVSEGEVLGIIGHNGAGKSTLLKILSRITEPSDGEVRIHGRVAALLEVGTGFHPELTGRENIYMNGTILGMRKKEIDLKLDEIIDFSGVEKHLDTPVKFYSSGMRVRLGFSVAAHLDPEILIVDEVLAVGDAEFQRKCLGKMSEVAHCGRTILFVSHNMQAISTITGSCMLLYQGQLKRYGKTSAIVNEYLTLNSAVEGQFKISNPPEDRIQIISAKINTSHSNYTHVCGQPLSIDFEIFINRPLRNGAFAFQILNSMEVPVVHCWIFETEKPLFSKAGMISLTCEVPKLRLYMGAYQLRLILAEDSGTTILQTMNNAIAFQVEMFQVERDYKWEPSACAYLEENNWRLKS